jgi:hypothetical protein
MAKKKKAAKKKARRTPTRRTPRKTVKKVRRPAKKVARVKAPRPAAPSVKLVVAEIDRLLESLKGRRSRSSSRPARTRSAPADRRRSTTLMCDHRRPHAGGCRDHPLGLTTKAERV